MTRIAPLSTRSPILRVLRGEPLRPPAARTLIEASGLPAETKALVADVVRRTGGTRFERADVARELLAHFEDAFSKDATMAEAHAAFGDPRAAAQLLRRAVRRKRGPIWQSWWWVSRGVAALVGIAILVYLGLVARFYGVKPTISIDSLARLQALAPAGAAGDQAWPILREAMTPLKPYRQGTWSEAGVWPNDIGPIECEDPSSPAWAAAAAALERHDLELAALRQAAALPTLGVTYGEFSEEDRAFFGWAPTYPERGRSIWSGAVFRILLPYLAESRWAARWLACDARHASAKGDAERAVDDVQAIVGLANQLRRPFLIDQLVAHAVLNLGLATTQSILASHPDAFRPADLARLAGILDSVANDDWGVSFDGERVLFDDMLQRAYSDDGQGDGRLLGSTLELGEHTQVLGTRTRDSGRSIIGAMAAPAISTVAPSRRELREQFDREVLAAESLAERPPWEWSREDWVKIGTPSQRLGHGLFALLALDGLLSAPMSPAAISIPPGTRQRLDTTRLAVAVIRHRAATGAWPTSIDELDPSFLPAIPRDQYDGKPLRYTLRGGGPVIWSIGPDRTDDQLGTVVSRTWNGAGGWQPPAGAVDTHGAPFPKGDVILWPPAPPEDDDVPTEALHVGHAGR